LEAHPGWEELIEDEEQHNLEEERQEEAKKAATDESKIGDEAAVGVIKTAKAEDDEYKTDDGEKNYYSIAHTVHEKVHGQASILINGKLKGTMRFLSLISVVIMFNAFFVSILQSIR